MSNYAAVCFGLLMAAPFSNITAGPADEDGQVQAEEEITYLLQSIQDSGCEFYRNGSWYDGKHARSHLQQKYDYFSARKAIHSAEDFIDKAATKSSLSNRQYQVRCVGSAPVATNLWLRRALLAYRARP